jgi:hypothetical protein
MCVRSENRTLILFPAEIILELHEHEMKVPVIAAACVRICNCLKAHTFPYGLCMFIYPRVTRVLVGQHVTNSKV